MATPKTFKTVDQYIRSFPQKTQAILRRIRRTIHAAAPGATEGISYNIPTFYLDGAYLIYFAGYARHVSIYPVPAVSAAVKKQLAPYVSGRGTVKFPLDEPIPFGLIKKLTLARIKAVREKNRNAAKD